MKAVTATGWRHDGVTGTGDMGKGNRWKWNRIRQGLQRELGRNRELVLVSSTQ